MRCLLAVFLVASGCAAPQSTSEPVAQVAAPAPDYAALLPAIRTAVEADYYAPHEFSQPRWQQFWRDVEAGLAEAQSEQDARGRFRDAASTLGLSHLDLYRLGDGERADTDSALDTPVHLDIGDDGVAVLTIAGFFSVDRTLQPVTEAFGRIVAEDPRALILDLRQNQGGDISSMLLAAHLIDAPAPAGLFLSRVWWETHDAVPPPSEWSSLPILTSPDMDAFYTALSEQGALVGFVPPLAPRYDGPVYVLAGPRTGSASEPLVYLLKSTGRATIVGQRTAAAMVSARTTALGDGWVLQHPFADYYTADGTRLDQVGVEPDVEMSLAEALATARALAME